MKNRQKKVVDSRFARGRGDYARIIRAIEKEGRCPFCPDNFKYHRKPILKRRASWFITEASWPYKNAARHFIILGTRHIERFEKIAVSDWRAIMFLASWAIRRFKIRGGGLAMRFGETRFTGATVCHIHAHLIVPELNRKTKTAKTVLFPIG